MRFPLRLAALAIGLLTSPERAPAADTVPSPAGLYQLEPGWFIGITVFSDQRTIFIDFKSGRTGTLKPGDEGTLVAHTDDDDDEYTVEPIRDAKKNVIAIRWKEPDEKKPREATRLTFRRRDLKFRNRDVSLGGTLVLPDGEGPFPAVVRIHGAGPSDRVNAIDEYFAAHGVAFFSYDKRGVGASTGNWKTAGVEDLAGDAAAAIALLRRQPEIDRARVGVGAGSEGGWVAAALTDRVPHLAFVFMLAAPALGFSDQLLNEVEFGLGQMEATPEEIRDALAFQRWKNEHIRSGRVFTNAGWKALEARADSLRDARWFERLAPWPRDSYRWKKYKSMMSFDPAPYWTMYRGPLLAFYGGKDRSVPAPRNVAALWRAIENGGNRGATIEILPTADHEGLDPGREDGDILTFAPGYLHRPLAWVLDKTRK